MVKSEEQQKTHRLEPDKYIAVIIQKYQYKKVNNIQEAVEIMKKYSELTGVPISFFMFTKDKNKNTINISVHYTFFIKYIKDNKMINEYNIKTDIINDRFIKCTFECDYNEGVHTKKYKYEMYDRISDKDEDIKKKIIMLQKTTVLNAIKFLFPEFYNTYSILNHVPIRFEYNKENDTKTGPRYGAQPVAQGTTNAQVTAKGGPPLQNQVSGNTSNTDPLKEKYSKLFKALRAQAEMSVEDFNKLIVEAKHNILGGKSPSNEKEYLEVYNHVASKIEEMISG